MYRLITHIANGEVVDKEHLQSGFNLYNNKKVEITIKRFAHRRSNPQNRYYWGVILPLITGYARELGEDLTEEQWHEYYVQKGYFGWKEQTINGVLEKLPNRSPEALTIEFTEAMQRIQREWAGRGLDLPDPNEELKEK